MPKSFFSRFFSALLVIILSLVALPVQPAHAATCTTTTTGSLWNDPAHWSGCAGGIPQNGDIVVIATDTTVNVGTNSLASLTIDSGQTLTIGNSSTNRNVTVQGTVTVNGTLNTAGDGGNTLSIGGNLVNNGTFDMNIGASTANVVFNSSTANQTVSGTGATTDFSTINLNNTAGAGNNVLEVTSSNFTSGSVTFTEGILKLSTGATITHTGNITLGTNDGLILNHSGATVNVANNNLTVTAGEFQLVSGTLNLGDGNDVFRNNGGTMTLSGGTLNINGQFRMTDGTTTLNGTTINIDPQNTSNLANNNHAFEATGAANVTFSSGTVTIIDPHATAGTGNAVQIVSGTGTKNFSGSTLKFGDGSSTTTGSTNGFDLNCGSGVVIGNVVVDNLATNLSTRFVRLITNDCNVGGNFTITAGEFQVNALDLSVAGNFTNNDTFTTGGTNTVILNGSSAQTLGGTSSTTFNNLTINNASGITLTNSETVNGTLNLTSGLVTTGANTMTVPASGAITNASSISYIDGKLARGYTAAGSKTFPVGKGGAYRPVTFNYTSAPGTSTVTIEQFEAAFPGSFTGVIPINRYWDISQSIANGPTFTVTLDGTGVSLTSPVMLKDDAGTTTSHAVTAAPPNYTNSSAFNTLSTPTHFTLGEVDNVFPSITNATSTTANGPYNEGDTVNITVNFNENISSTGLTINLNSGASLSTGTLTNINSFVGTYTVSAGENSSDLTITSITGTITDAASNNTVDPAVPGGQNIADNKDIAIDTAAPSTSASPAGGTYNATQNVSLTCDDSSGTGCAATYYCTGAACTPSTLYSGSIAISSSTDLRFYSSDNAGNDETVQTESYVIDTAAPTVSSITRADGNPTNAASVDFTVTFSEPVIGGAFSNFTIVTSGSISSATITNVTAGPGTTRTVSVSTGSGDGTIQLNLTNGTGITDLAGNPLTTSFFIGEVYTVQRSGPAVSIGAPSPSDTNSGPVNFPVTITGATSVNLLDVNVTLNTTGTATGSVSVTNGTTDSPTITINNITGNGTIGINIAAGIAADSLSNTSPAAGPSTTFNVDNTPPQVALNGINSNNDTGDGMLSELEVTTVAITQITVTFNEDVTAASATDTANYMLVNSNGNGFDDAPTLTTCATGINPNGGDDIPVPINSATYDNNGGSGPFTATLDLGTALPNGIYRLYVCGTTSIEDAAGNELNRVGNTLSDFVRNFIVSWSGGNNNGGGGGGGGNNNGGGGGGYIPITGGFLPVTGFAPGVVTQLPAQPVDMKYAATDVWIEIPRLGVTMPIVGVPIKDKSWDVSWLWKDAGWLEGTAFPGWDGNSVLTGHVYLSNGKPGPFIGLDKLKFGDKVIVHAYGYAYTFEVQENLVVKPNDMSVLKHQEDPWLTLLTCKTYNEKTGKYENRIAVRASLLSVAADTPRTVPSGGR